MIDTFTLDCVTCSHHRDAHPMASTGEDPCTSVGCTCSAFTPVGHCLVQPADREGALA